MLHAFFTSSCSQAGEHVPLLADGLVCLHKYRGQSAPEIFADSPMISHISHSKKLQATPRTEAEERARAFSLQKHLSKDAGRGYGLVMGWE